MAATTRAIFEPEAPDPGDQESWDAEERNFKHLLNGVLLFGTADVRRVADDLNDLHARITVEWWDRLAHEREQGHEPSSLAGGFPQHRLDEWKQALAELVDAMRRDVAPA